MKAVERLVALTLEEVPANATHWSTRTMARRTGMSQSAVSRIWRAFGLRPHQADTFKLSADPAFVEKVRDVVGLYLAPPDRALVLCVDEKPQIQAVQGTAAAFPLRPGRAERVTHDYRRHGTLDLFAALDVKARTVIGSCKPRHRSVEFRAFLEQVESSVARDLEVHLVLDNLKTHKTTLVHDWLVQHPRFHLHFTPTSASWLNLVECWFSVLSRRRGTKMADTFEAQVEGYVAAMAAVQQQHRGVKPGRRASPEDVAEFTRSIANHELAAEMRAKRATRAQKQAERQAKAEAEMSPSLALARRQITKRIVAADKRLVDALLDYALFLRAIRSEIDPAQEKGRTFGDAASLQNYLAGLGAA